jgi:hypothetical protein
VVFRTDGTPEYGAVVLRLEDGARTMARVPAEDSATLGVLMSAERSAVGRSGRLSEGQGGLQRWEA